MRTALIEMMAREQIACYLSVDFGPLRSRHFDKPSVALNTDGFIVKRARILRKERDRQVVPWSRSVSTSYNGPRMTSDPPAPSPRLVFADRRRFSVAGSRDACVKKSNRTTYRRIVPGTPDHGANALIRVTDVRNITGLNFVRFFIGDLLAEDGESPTMIAIGDGNDITVGIQSMSINKFS
uniref:hypothetical protein n=1 Tax=Burkholderia diffusa TaxID=488732 RepID=UPI001CC38BE9|nr:hypothetical protein [Burkholderia diffusa]